MTPQPRSHLAHAVVVLEEDAELAVLVQALADELSVARLEDVQRRLLAREQARGSSGKSPISPTGAQVKVFRHDAVPLPSRHRRSRALRAGQARRGGAARARPRARRQARVQRGSVRAASRRARGARARGRPSSTATPTAGPTGSPTRSPAKHGVEPAERHRRGRGGRGDHVPLARRPRPRRRDRLRLALLPELRARRGQAGSGRRSRCPSPTTATTSSECSPRSPPRTKIVYLCNPNNPTGRWSAAPRSTPSSSASPSTS